MCRSGGRCVSTTPPGGGTPAPALFLDELLEEYGDSDQILLVEMKAPQARDQFIEMVWPYKGQAIVQSFDDTMTSIFTRAGLNALQLVSGTSNPTIIDDVYAIGMHKDRINQQTASRITGAGARLGAWGAGLVSSDPAYVRLGVDGFLVDDPTH